MYFSGIKLIILSIHNPLNCISKTVVLTVTVTLQFTFKRQFYYHSMQNKARKLHWRNNMRSLENVPQSGVTCHHLVMMIQNGLKIQFDLKENPLS